MFNYRIQSLRSIILLCCCFTSTSSFSTRCEVRVPEDEEEMHSKNGDSIVRNLPSFGVNSNKDCQGYLVDRRERSINENVGEINNSVKADDESLITRSSNAASGGEEVLKNPEDNKNSSLGFFRGIEDFFNHLKPNTTLKVPSKSLKTDEELERRIVQSNENIKRGKIRNLLKNKIPSNSDRRATFDFEIKAVPIRNRRNFSRTFGK